MRRDLNKWPETIRLKSKKNGTKCMRKAYDRLYEKKKDVRDQERTKKCIDTNRDE